MKKFVLLILVISLYSCGSGSSSGSQFQEQKYSDGALRTSTDRIERWIGLGYLKIDSDTYEVHVSPDLWNDVDVDGKKEVMSTVLIYMEGVKGYEFSFIDFKNKNTDKNIGRWSKTSGLRIEN